MRNLLTAQWLSVPTALNLRDVGGLPTTDGARVRNGVLLRSGSLRQLSADDAHVLIAEYGVRTVADLRTPREVAADGPSRLAEMGAATLHLPLINELDPELSGLEGSEPGGNAAAVLAGTYRTLLDRRGRHLVTLARMLAWSSTGATLVHCALGKDRTGVAIALLLTAIGVKRSAVLDDYAATNDVIDSVLPRLIGGIDGIDITTVPLAARVAEPAALAAVLDHLDRDHGGATNWLRLHGLEDGEIDLLRRRLVDGAANSRRC